MAKTPKQTPVTLENLIPAIEKSLLPKVERIVKTEVAKFKTEVNDRFDELESKIKYLPTTEMYLASQDKLMGELQKSREATEFTGQHYKDVTKRIEYIDNFLHIDSSLD